jgi:hypothetical protein
MDIAVGMCRITRYAGAVWCPLAAHSIIVAEFAYRLAHTHQQLWYEGKRPDPISPDLMFAIGLLHDAHETVTGEITRHYKPPEMKPLERELDVLIHEELGVDFEVKEGTRKAIKAMDEMALAVEAITLGLIGWPAYYERMEKRSAPKLSAEEVRIGMRILERWSNERMVRAGSEEISILNRALQHVKTGQYALARAAVLDFE